VRTKQSRPQIPWGYILTVAAIAALLTVVLYDTVRGFVWAFPLLAAALVGVTTRKGGVDHMAITGALTLGTQLLVVPRSADACPLDRGTVRRVVSD
jgi:ABC-type uncharacterized transport system permease subunit